MGLGDWFSRVFGKDRPAKVRLSTPTHRDEVMMRRALDLARFAAQDGEVPVGAVVFETKTGDLLGEGWNTREAEDDPSAHAEHKAIVEASKAIGDWRLNECTVVVTLEPCPMCAGLIINARVGRVVYGALDPKAGAVQSVYQMLSDRRLNHQPEIVAGVFGEEAGRMLSDFFRSRRDAKKTQKRAQNGGDA